MAVITKRLPFHARLSPKSASTGTRPSALQLPATQVVLEGTRDRSCLPSGPGSDRLTARRVRPPMLEEARHEKTDNNHGDRED